MQFKYILELLCYQQPLTLTFVRYNTLLEYNILMQDLCQILYTIGTLYP